MSLWLDPELTRAYAACEAMARSHYENFPVASRLLPAAMRPHVAAVYAFARVADDIVDEGDMSPAARREGLRRWQDRVHRAAAGRSEDRRVIDRSPRDRDDLIALALGHSIRSFDLPLSLFDDLLSAFDQDTMTTRYASWSDVLDYCRRSANPVGRLVLRIAGYRDEALNRSSDALCTALQLTNFWQDFGRDWRAGRLYIPRDEQNATGAGEADLEGGHMSVAWMETLAAATARTRQMFWAGRDVCDGVSGRLGLELRFTWLGGTRVLEHVERVGGRLLECRPTLGPRDVPTLLWRAVTWRTGRTRRAA